MRTTPPSVAPLSSCSTLAGNIGTGDDEHSKNFDNSVNAVSFGLVATAILISMFLFMALFERFLRPPSSGGDLDSPHGKLEYPSTKVGEYILPPFLRNIAPLSILESEWDERRMQSREDGNAPSSIL